MSQRLPNIRFVGLGVATACELLLSALTPLHPTRAAAQESPARLLAAYALALRNADVAGDDSAAAILANMPEAGMASVESRFRPCSAAKTVYQAGPRTPADVRHGRVFGLGSGRHLYGAARDDLQNARANTGMSLAGPFPDSAVQRKQPWHELQDG